MRIITIVGARPQFVKAAMISHAIKKYNMTHASQIEENILHTGQHYDENMSKIFFSLLEIPTPKWNLHCGNGSHGAMTGTMLIAIEKILIENKPDYVLVYGDTNSTLAGSLAASKLHIPVIHVEAGLRSFNKEMPEEINRILTDHVSTLLCCPTTAAVENLKNEGITDGVWHVGDVMYDAALVFGSLAEKHSTVMKEFNLSSKSFILSTVHRAENTDNPERLANIIEALCRIASVECPVVLPLHPRTKACAEAAQLIDKLYENKNILLVSPLNYLDMIMLEKNAKAILTDSGGVQKEAYFHKTPCITLREQTEWVETVDAGWNQIAGWRTENILNCLNREPEKKEISEYGNGDTANKILNLL